MSNLSPIILSEGKYTLEHIDRLKKQYNISQVKDIYVDQLKEYFEIIHPDLEKQSQAYNKELNIFLKQRETPSALLKGNWIYFPWKSLLLHTVTQAEYNQLRTNRNRDIVTQQEQQQLFNYKVGLIGLSLGSSIALSLAYSGIANTMKLCERDILETTNLNRLRASITQVGDPKISIAAQQIYEINPYADLVLYDKGLNNATIKDFVGQPRPDIIFEAVDDFEMKVKIRLEARKKKIPVVMLTSLGDTILIDIENYKSEEHPLFHGRIGNVIEDILTKPIKPEDKNKYAVAIVGKEHIAERVMNSVKEVGKTLVGRPQLGSTVTMVGGIASYITRRFVLGTPLKSGRYRVSLDTIFSNSLIVENE